MNGRAVEDNSYQRIIWLVIIGTLENRENAFVMKQLWAKHIVRDLIEPSICMVFQIAQIKAVKVSIELNISRF